MPWTSLRECASNGRPPAKGDFWRVNFSRVEWRTEVKDGEYCKVLNPDTGKPYPEDNWVWSPMGIVNMHYPELWGYVVFTEEQGPDSFELSSDERIKWELRKLYYRERNYFAAHGRFTDDGQLLMGDEAWSISPAIETTSKLFQISAPSTDGSTTFYIKEDGKLWKE